MNVVITGATGMIGMNYIKYLLDKQCAVLALVREKSKLQPFLHDSNLEVVECDLHSLNGIELPQKKYDVFYHLAWEGTRGQDRNNVEMQLKNIDYTINALKLAKKMGCKTFIGAGSQAEYGKVEGKMAPDTPTFPDTAYGVAKLCAGQMSRIMANQMGIKHIWARILSIYGPHDNENTMIMSSIKEMLNHQSPEYTKAEQTWDYLYIEDMVQALYLMGEKGKDNAIYCVGSGKAKPLYTYIEEIRNQINQTIPLKLGAKPYPQNQVMCLYADILKLTHDTGFIPQTDFKEGIQKTIAWWRKEKKVEK